MVKKILVGSEASYLNTGYASYGRELIKRLISTGKYEVAEMSCYGSADDDRRKEIPWKNYPVAPSKSDSDEVKQIYGSNPTNQFGAWRFERMCLDFKPDVVCFPEGSLVLTDGGYKEINHLSKGELVLTHKNRFMPISATMSREYDGDLVEIYGDGVVDPMCVTPEHPVLVYKAIRQTNQKKSVRAMQTGREPVFIPAKDVSVGDFVVLSTYPHATAPESIKISDYIQDLLEEDGLVYTNNYCKRVINDIAINRDFGLLCGYIASDGHVCRSGIHIYFGLHEIEFGDDCINLFNNIFGAKATKLHYEGHGCYRISCNSIVLAKFFKRYLSAGRYTSIIPKEIFNGDVDTKSGFVRGMIRGDGCYRKNTVALTTVNVPMAYSFRSLLASLGICSTINRYKYNNGENWQDRIEVSCYGENAEVIHSIVQKWDSVNTPQNCQRRAIRTHLLANGHILSRIKKISSRAYTGTVYNIEVSVDNSYTSNFVVHNCMQKDPWMDSWVKQSPFRPFFSWSWASTVDSAPQNPEWINQFADADYFYTLSEWAEGVVKDQAGDAVNLIGSVTMCAADEFKPVPNKAAHRLSMGLDPDWKIIGTVMRNQRRKLFPDLLEAFALYLAATGDEKTYLYCHTSYPDNGWDLPQLMIKYGISSRVLFTYSCENCGKLTVSKFSDAIKQCKECKTYAAKLCSVSNGATTEELAKIFNLFDLYIQCANCLTPEQGILTSTGWKNTEDVNIGELVLTHKNRWRPVVNTFKHNHTGNVLTFTTHSDNEELTVTDEHPLFGLFSDDYSVNEKRDSFRSHIGDRLKIGKEFIPTFKKARDVKAGDFIAYAIDQEEIDHTIDLQPYNNNQYVVEGDTYRHKNSSVTHNSKHIVDADLAKWIGLYVADGCSMLTDSCGSVTVTCNEKDMTNVELSEKVMARFGTVSVQPYPEKHAVAVQISNKVFATYLLEHCCKHEHKKLPEWVAKLPLPLQKEVLSGLFMGDGCYYEKRKISSYSTISLNLCRQIKHLCRRLSINYNINPIQKAGNRKLQYRFEIAGNVSIGAYKTTRASSMGFYHGGYAFYQIKEVATKEYAGFVYNLEVEEDNSYTGRMGSMHNSEGMGISQMEAAACGIPVMSTDYSAMESIVRKVGGFPIPLKTKVLELETGCYRAIPDIDEIVSYWEMFFSLPENERLECGQNTLSMYRSNFNWDEVVKKWMVSLDAAPNASWDAPHRQIRLPEKDDIPKLNNNKDFLDWAISTYLPYSGLKNSYEANCLLRDLNFQSYKPNPCGYFYSENSYFNRTGFADFNKQHVLKMFRGKAETFNFWENVRCGKRKLQEEDWLK